MSVSAYLVCAEDRAVLGLGKPLMRPDGTIETFALGSSDAADVEFIRALWTFLDACGDRGLRLGLSSDADFEEVAAYREIGGWEEDGDLPFEDYLRREPVHPTTYYAKIRPGHPREDPSGIVRRRIVDGREVDEAFTRHARWEPTEYLRRYALGHDDVEHVEITEAEALRFVLRALARRLPRS